MYFFKLQKYPSNKKNPPPPYPSRKRPPHMCSPHCNAPSSLAVISWRRSHTQRKLFDSDLFMPQSQNLHLALRQLPQSPNHHHPVFSLAFCRRFCSGEERPLGTLELSRFAPPRSLFDSFTCSYFKSRSGGWPYYNLIYYLVAASFEPRPYYNKCSLQSRFWFESGSLY